MQKRIPFFHHLHPPAIPLSQARWRYTLGAGGLALYFSLTLLVSGALEMFYYVATPEQAALSIQTLTYLVPLGSLVRDLHFWAAQLLVIVMLFHLLRVIFTGAYAPPRQFNYLLGLFLSILVLMLDFSGYILRWDDGVRWALVVGTNLLKTIPFLGNWLYLQVVGADHPSLSTLTRFYAEHVFGLVLLAGILLVWHVFRVRRDGGISAPREHVQSQLKLHRAELVRREILAAILATIILLLLAAFLPAPIASPIESWNSVAVEARAPWFFLWVQGLVRVGDPFWMGIIVPFGVVIFLALIPYISPIIPSEEQGHWFPRKGRAVQILVGGVVIIIIALSIWELLQ